MKKYIYMTMEKIAIVRDKLDYLGAKYCNQTERKLAVLADFPPLNYCCYPAVSEQYVVPRENPWVPSAEAHQVMQELAATVLPRKQRGMLSSRSGSIRNIHGSGVQKRLPGCCRKSVMQKLQIF